MQIEQIDRDAVDDYYGHPAIDDRLAEAFAAHRHAARPDDSAVERVAIALHHHDHPDAIMPWEQFSDEWKVVYRHKARAAIAALGDSGPCG